MYVVTDEKMKVKFDIDDCLSYSAGVMVLVILKCLFAVTVTASCSFCILEVATSSQFI